MVAAPDAAQIHHAFNRVLAQTRPVELLHLGTYLDTMASWFLNNSLPPAADQPGPPLPSVVPAEASKPLDRKIHLALLKRLKLD